MSRLGNAAITGAADIRAILAAHESARDTTAREVLRTVPVDALTRSPWQPRTAVDVGSEEFLALVDSIQAHGVLEPLLAREFASGGVELLAGERRLEAARAAKLAAVPVRVLVGLDDPAARAVALTENLARKDLTAWEEAAAVALLRDARREAGLPTDVRALAGAAGRSRTVTAELLRVADTLTPAVVEEARRLAGGAFVRTPDTLPHRDLAAVARLEATADRARALALLAGPIVTPPRPRRGAAGGAAGAAGGAGGGAGAPSGWRLAGTLAKRFTFRLARPVEALDATEAAAALDALQPLLRALRRQAKGTV
jgi:ParB/RepB/Spo0J family partition protein